MTPRRDGACVCTRPRSAGPGAHGRGRGGAADGPCGGAGGRWCEEDGFYAGIEALAFGVLVFVVGTLLVLNAWAVVDAKLAATAAAREAVRAYVEAPAEQGVIGAEARGRAAGAATLAGYGKDREGAASVALTVDRSDPGGALVRCAQVTAVVSYRVPTLVAPFVGAYVAGPITVHATHVELVDPYRAGLAGEADCAP